MSQVTKSRTHHKILNIKSIKHTGLKMRIELADKESPVKYPTKVQIETSSRCNLRCPECSHSREKGSGKNLSLDEFKRVVSFFPFRLKHVTISGIGEPLLNPHFFSIVDYLAKIETTCEFYTNGTLLTKEIGESIVKRPNIVSLAISCDGARKETFENFRLGADFEDWKRSVSDLVDEKNGHENPRIGMNTVINKQNINELEDIIRLASELGFNSVNFLDPIPIDDLSASNMPSDDEMFSLDFKHLQNVGASLGLNTFWTRRRDKVPPKVAPRCMQPWEYIFIRANGKVQPCCAVFGSDKAAVMGDIFEEGFEDIWNGERFREFRKTSAMGTNQLCSICSYN